MTNKEKKHIKWNQLLINYKHLEKYCIIEAKGIDDDNIYFHPTFTISNNVYVTSQADCGRNNEIYAFKFIINDGQYYFVDIPEILLSEIIIGYNTNKDMVMLALKTLANIRNHINNINMYTTEYVNHLLIGNSIKDVTKHFINELDATNKAIEFLQKQNKQD
jgi:hypothetical protein